jgi:hypothetical protein
MPLELSEKEMAALVDLLTEASEPDRHPTSSRLRPRRGDPAEFRDEKRPAANRSARPRPAVRRRRR